MTQTDKEWWAYIPEHTGYMISNKGRVMSYKNKKSHIIRKLTYTRYGDYHRVNLYKNGKTQFFIIDQMVAEEFVSKPSDEHKYVHHINGDTLDDRACNLEWRIEKSNKDPNPQTTTKTPWAFEPNHPATPKKQIN